MNKCVNCFKPTNGAQICPHCGHDQSVGTKFNNVLPPFTVLNNIYIVGRVLGKGGFGVTYIAQDTTNGRICAIKEYMPAEYSQRPGGTLNISPYNDEKSRYVFSHGREKFILEAQTLLKLRSNPIVVDILDYFEQNNTAYLVMEYLDGQDLRKMARASGGKLDPKFVKNVFVMVASSLMEIHRMNILHRDLSPENIIVTSKGNVKLIDFGAARNFVSTQNKGMSILLKPGFAPPEQYNKQGNHGPWSDVYALCATFYNLVSGQPLVDALFRYRGEKQPSLISLGCNVSKKTSAVIEKGLELDYKKRYKNFKEVLDDIDIETAPQKQPVNNSGQQGGFVQQQRGYQQGQNIPQGGFGQQQRGFQQGQNIPQGGFGQQQRGYQQGQNISQGGFGQQQRGFQQGQNISQGGFGQQQRGFQQGQNIPNRGTAPQPDRFAKLPYVAAIVGNSLYSKVMLNTNTLVKIGRNAATCQCVIKDDTNVSREHCVLRFDGRNIYIKDTSVNGTFLASGVRLPKDKETIIQPGTRFYLATPNHLMIVQ